MVQLLLNFPKLALVNSKGPFNERLGVRNKLSSTRDIISCHVKYTTFVDVKLNVMSDYNE